MDAKTLIKNGRLRYSCKCGWVDIGHADPKTVRPGIGPRHLWSQILNETGKQTVHPRADGFKVTYTQDAAVSFLGVKVHPGVTRSYLVSPFLRLPEKESVALGIFREVSEKFETKQGLAFWSGSDFSVEDLVSNLISFYLAVRPGPDYLKLCEVVSEAESLKVLDRYPKALSVKNKDFRPIYFESDACSCSGPFPPALQAIKPAVKGKLFRDWTLQDEIPHYDRRSYY
jgi:hypothetical protein